MIKILTFNIWPPEFLLFYYTEKNTMDRVNSKRLYIGYIIVNRCMVLELNSAKHYYKTCSFKLAI